MTTHTSKKSKKKPGPPKRLPLDAKLDEPEEDPRREAGVTPKKVRFTTSIPAELLDRCRDAGVALGPEGLNLSRITEQALELYLVRLQKQFNKGEPFPKRKVPLQRGRPISS